MNKLTTLSTLHFLRIALTILCLFLVPKQQLFSQKKAIMKVECRVLDLNVKPIANATIKRTVGNDVIYSNSEGKFTVNAATGDTIIVSFEGYRTQNAIVGKKPRLQILMIDDGSKAEDVILIGYDTKKRKELSDSFFSTSVSLVPLLKTNPASFDLQLGGRMAGVNATSGDGQPGTYSSLIIRGRTLSADASPLYVIDGLPIDNPDLNSINPGDIESLNVLKDASSLSLYGSRGANAVILITTKRGYVSDPVINYSFSEGLQLNKKSAKLMSPYEFVKLQLELDSIQSISGSPVTTNHQLYLSPTNGITLDSYKNKDGYNAQKALYQTGIVENHFLNIVGGNQDTKYYFSGGLFNQRGIIIGTGLKKYSGSAILDQKINSRLKVGFSVHYTSTMSQGTIPTATDSNSILQNAWAYRPITGISNQNLVSSLIDSLGLADGNLFVNPKIQAQNEYRKNTYKTYYATAYGEYVFSNMLKLRVTGSYSSTDNFAEQFYNSYTTQGNALKTVSNQIINTRGVNGSIGTYTNSNKYLDGVLTFKRNFQHKQQLNIILGTSMNAASTDGNYYSVYNVPIGIQDLGIISINSGRPNYLVVTPSEWLLYSVFGKLNYAIQDKYMLTLSNKLDGSSKFAANHRWGYFPAAAFDWNLSKESFIKKQLPTFIDNIRFRAMYGISGNNKIGDYGYFGSYSSGKSYGYSGTSIYNPSYTPGLITTTFENEKLTWETAKQVDLGLNFSMLQNKLNVDITYYHKKTSGTPELIMLNYPYNAGISAPNVNEYKNLDQYTINSGLELTANYTIIHKKDFSWVSNFNISFNRNQFISHDINNMTYNWGLNGNAPAWISRSGNAVSSFYGYKWAGVYQFGDFNRAADGTYSLKAGITTYSQNVQPGDPKYQDMNGDSKVDSTDQSIIGRIDPIFYGGINNDFTYKNFDLNVFLQFNYGNDILNANKAVFERGAYLPHSNQFASFENRWTPNNPTNDLPAARYGIGDAGSAITTPNSRYIESGSYIRLKAISLGYQLPANCKLLKKSHIASIRVFVAAENLFTITKYSGTDPEVSTFRNSNAGMLGTGYSNVQSNTVSPNLTRGYDYTPYPRAISVSMGANVHF